MTLFAYHKLCSWDWVVRDTAGISYNKLRLSWIAYLKLLNYGSLQEMNMVCSECEQNPKIIICDGITLSFEKKYVTKFKDSTDLPTDLLKGSK